MIDKTNVETSDELACTDRDWTPRGIVMITKAGLGISFI